MLRKLLGRNVKLDRKKVADVIKKIEICMMTTTGADGQLRSRPMTNQQVEWDGEAWFFAPADSSQTEDIEQNPNVNLAYALPNKTTYLSASGRAQIVHDDARKQALWSPVYKMWFPDGPEGDSVVLIKVDVEHVQYWSKKGEGELTL